MQNLHTSRHQITQDYTRQKFERILDNSTYYHKYIYIYIYFEIKLSYYINLIFNVQLKLIFQEEEPKINEKNTIGTQTHRIQTNSVTTECNDLIQTAVPVSLAMPLTIMQPMPIMQSIKNTADQTSDELIKQPVTTDSNVQLLQTGIMEVKNSYEQFETDNFLPKHEIDMQPLKTHLESSTSSPVRKRKHSDDENNENKENMSQSEPPTSSFDHVSSHDDQRSPLPQPSVISNDQFTEPNTPSMINNDNVALNENDVAAVSSNKVSSSANQRAKLAPICASTGSAKKKPRLLIGKCVEKTPDISMSTLERIGIQIDSMLSENMTPSIK